jgi:hypothetical protein
MFGDPFEVGDVVGPELSVGFFKNTGVEKLEVENSCYD